MLSFLYFSALTGNGFACHVTLVTGCVMDGILVRALLCLRHTAGLRHPATSHSTCHAPHPAHITLYYEGFSLTAPRFRCSLAVAFHPCLVLFVSLGICLLHTVHHCRILCDSFRICIFSSFNEKVIFFNNTVSPSKGVSWRVPRHRIFPFHKTQQRQCNLTGPFFQSGSGSSIFLHLIIPLQPIIVLLYGQGVKI